MGEPGNPIPEKAHYFSPSSPTPWYWGGFGLVQGAVSKLFLANVLAGLFHEGKIWSIGVEEDQS
jgi:hypothetical protein